MDPKRTQPLHVSKIHAEWMMVEVPERWYNQLTVCEPLKPFLHNVSRSKGRKIVVHELVYLAAAWHFLERFPLEVAFLAWDDFRDLLLDESTVGRDSLKSRACAIVGGIDMALEIDLKERGLEGNRLDTYIRRLQELGEEVTLWPHIDEQIKWTKWVQIGILDKIAREVTGTHRPRTFVVTQNTRLVDIAGMVLKREGAEASDHVLLPGKRGYPKQNGQLRDLVSVAGQYRWLAQEFVGYLKRVGEWRVFFCGGREMFTVHTNPTRDSTTIAFSNLRRRFTLRRLKDFMNENSNYTVDDATNCPWVTLDEMSEGHEELGTFARKTYDAILREDRTIFQHDFLSMQLWCRLDISVIDVPGRDELHYFVNEVEKFQSTCIWGKLENPAFPLETLACESAEVLCRYLSQRYELVD